MHKKILLVFVTISSTLGIEIQASSLATRVVCKLIKSEKYSEAQTVFHSLSEEEKSNLDKSGHIYTAVTESLDKQLDKENVRIDNQIERTKFLRTVYDVKGELNSPKMNQLKQKLDDGTMSLSEAERLQQFFLRKIAPK
jgi:hypothetical protein